MLIQVFKRFKEISSKTKSFNQTFYEHLLIQDPEKPVFSIKITENMCDGEGLMHRSGIISLFDGITIMTLLATYNIEGDSVSITMNTMFFADCNIGNTILFYPKVLKYEKNTNLGIITAKAFVDKTLIAENIHNAYVLSSQAKFNNPLISK